MKKAKAIKFNATNPSHWLKARHVPTYLKEQIKSMTKTEQKVAFSKKPLAFGTAGIRAKMGPGTQYLNKFVYQQMMVGFCKYVLSKSSRKHPWIIIGHDNRMHSEEFTQECTDIALAMGLNVYQIEENRPIPTPIISYAIRRLKLDGGVNITASHNPKEDNGFKVYNKIGAQLLPEDANIIIKNMPSGSEILNLNRYLRAKNVGELEFLDYDDLAESFFNRVIKATVIDKRILLPNAPIKNMPIVFTGFHGTTSILVPRFLEKLGFKKVYVYPKHASIDGEFKDCPISNPEDPKAFKGITEFATKMRSTIIIGCDPDGDRLSIGFKKRNRWRFLSGNEMGIVFTHYILSKTRHAARKPVIYSTYVSTSYIDRITKKFNAEIVRTKTGFKWMCNLLDKLSSKKEFILAFEEAIGCLTHDVCRDKDCFGAILLALEIYNHGSAYFPDLHDYLCDRIFDKYGPTFSATYSYALKSKDWEKDAKKLMFRAKHFKQKKLFDYHIKKIWFEKESDCVVWTLNMNSWIKFRLSGTEPKFKVYVNFNDEMAGQLKAAAIMNIAIIERNILKGFKYAK